MIYNNMIKFIIALTLASIAFSLSYYYRFQVLPEFFIGSTLTSIFWLLREINRNKSIDNIIKKSTDNIIKKSIDNIIKSVLEREEERENQLILLKEQAEGREKELVLMSKLLNEHIKENGHDS